LADRLLEKGRSTSLERSSPDLGIAATGDEDDRQGHLLMFHDLDQVETPDDRQMQIQNETGALPILIVLEEGGHAVEVAYLHSMGFEQQLQRIANGIVVVDEIYRFGGLPGQSVRSNDPFVRFFGALRQSTRRVLAGESGISLMSADGGNRRRARG